MNRNKALFSTKNMTTMAILAGISALLFMIEIPVVWVYKLDLSHLPVLLGTFSMGPVAGLCILAVMSSLGLLHSTTQGVGELADFLMGVAMAIPSGWIYLRQKTRKGAILSMVVGTLCAVVVGFFLNIYLMIPFFSAVYKLPVESIIAQGQAIVPFVHNVWEFVLYITTPFNLLKWTVISTIGALIYKPLSPLLRGKNKR